MTRFTAPVPTPRYAVCMADWHRHWLNVPDLVSPRPVFVTNVYESIATPTAFLACVPRSYPARFYLERQQDM